MFQIFKIRDGKIQLVLIILIKKNVSIQENRYKAIYRRYLTPDRIKMMFPQSNGQCWRCQKDEAGFMHMWCGCAKIKVFWTQGHGVLQSMVRRPLPLVPRVMLLGDFVN